MVLGNRQTKGVLDDVFLISGVAFQLAFKRKWFICLVFLGGLQSNGLENLEIDVVIRKGLDNLE